MVHTICFQDFLWQMCSYLFNRHKLVDYAYKSENACLPCRMNETLDLRGSFASLTVTTIIPPWIDIRL